MKSTSDVLGVSRQRINYCSRVLLTELGESKNRIRKTFDNNLRSFAMENDWILDSNGGYGNRKDII